MVRNIYEMLVWVGLFAFFGWMLWLVLRDSAAESKRRSEIDTSSAYTPPEPTWCSTRSRNRRLRRRRKNGKA